jgi:hypothetical protein
LIYDGGDFVFLEETDAGNARCSGSDARGRVLEGDAAEGEHGKALWLRRRFGVLGDGQAAAGFGENLKADSTSCAFTEDRGEDGEVGALRLRAAHFVRGMARHADDGRARRPQGASVAGGDVVRREVHAVCACRNCDIRTRVDQQLGARVGYTVRGFMSEGFEFAGGEIFFAELDVVQSGMRRFGDLGEEARALFVGVAGELAPIGDVVKEQGKILNKNKSQAVSPGCLLSLLLFARFVQFLAAYANSDLTSLNPELRVLRVTAPRNCLAPAASRQLTQVPNFRT